MTVDLFNPVMAGMLTCLTDRLTSNGVPVGRSGLVHGTEEAWDDCCAGQAYVRLVQVYPTMGNGGGGFPAQDTVHTNCGINMLAARLAIGVLRCAATQDDNGVAPTAATITTETASHTLDTSIILESIMCCLPSVAGVQASKIDAWNPKATLGGCRGGEWQVIVAVGHCGCP